MSSKAKARTRDPKRCQ